MGLKFGQRLCAELKDEIMKEAHCTPYTANPSSIKMYQDLRHSFLVGWDKKGYRLLCVKVFSMQVA